jgi:hypothetical protein
MVSRWLVGDDSTTKKRQCSLSAQLGVASPFFTSCAVRVAQVQGMHKKRVPAPKPATEADTVAAAASKHAASIAVDIACITKRRNLGRKTTWNSRSKSVNPLAAFEAVARLPDTSSSPHRPPTYAKEAGTWQAHQKM